jgi:hypothetical protein
VVYPVGAGQQITFGSNFEQIEHGQVVHPEAGRNASQAPRMHSSSTAHRLPQPPQWSGSVSVETQAKPLPTLHFDSPAPQLVPVALHAPAKHTSPEAHAVPQPPQCVGSLLRSMQGPPLHEVSPGRQTHAPPLHVSAAAHDLPQAPQAVGSIVVSMHTPPHSLPVAQVQAPETQVPVLPHEMPHPPQFAGSVEGVTHLPPHRMSPKPVQLPPSGTTPSAAVPSGNGVLSEVVPSAVVPSGEVPSALVPSVPPSSMAVSEVPGSTGIDAELPHPSVPHTRTHNPPTAQLDRMHPPRRLVPDESLLISAYDLGRSGAQRVPHAGTATDITSTKPGTDDESPALHHRRDRRRGTSAP